MFCVGAERIALSISVGAATHEPGLSAEQLIERADHAMYAMKRSNAATGVFSSRIKLDELVGRIHAA
jgi:GGDEF domain-containing protein